MFFPNSYGPVEFQTQNRILHVKGNTERTKLWIAVESLLFNSYHFTSIKFDVLGIEKTLCFLMVCFYLFVCYNKRDEMNEALILLNKAKENLKTAYRFLAGRVVKFSVFFANESFS